MERKAFWYIVHIDNIKSVLENGILCRDLCRKKGIHARDISNKGVQQRRERYHAFVPLYFACNTPMLFVVIEEHREKIVLLEIVPQIARVKGVLFADGNLASADTKIYADICDLSRLAKDRWDIVWGDGPSLSREWKRIRSMELLVPTKVPSCYIKGVHVQNQRILEVIEGIKDECRASFEIIQDLTEKGIGYLGDWR